MGRMAEEREVHQLGRLNGIRDGNRIREARDGRETVGRSQEKGLSGSPRQSH